jgi:hypothetical protein
MQRITHNVMGSMIFIAGIAVQRRRSPTPRPWRLLWNRDVIAGFGASALFGVMVILMNQTIWSVQTRKLSLYPDHPQTATSLAQNCL